MKQIIIYIVVEAIVSNKNKFNHFRNQYWI